MESRPYLLHALSPLHAGTGQAVNVIDLPIARARSTGIPFVPGSSVKGVLRDARERSLDRETHRAVFGPAHGQDGENAADHAGALLVHDARLLALPVRSFCGTFAWVSSPLLLHLARRDLQGVRGVPAEVSVLSSRAAVVGTLEGDDASMNVRTEGESRRVYLEDLDLPLDVDTGRRAVVLTWANFLAPYVWDAQPSMFSRRFLVVDDETMTFLWTTATQVDTRVRISSATRTVEDKALWTEESLPSESLLLGLFSGDRARRPGVKLEPREVLDKALKSEATLQFGGKATVGRGRCRIVPVTVREASEGERAR